MSDYRKNDSAKYGTSFNLPTGENLNFGQFSNENENTNKNEFMNKGKRRRDSDEGNSNYPRENFNKMAHNTPGGYSGKGRELQRKKELVRKIIENLNNIDESVKENSFLKASAENIKNFTNEDLAKFFQVMANVQYICSQDSDNFIGKNKEFITVNEKMLNYNPEKFDEEPSYETIKDINKIIVRKDLPLKTFLKDKMRPGQEIELPSPSNKTSTSNVLSDDQLLSFKSFIEDLLKTLKKENAIENIQIKNLIKIYSNFIYNNGIISFTNVDKLLLDFIIENSLIQNDISNFYSLCKFWLFEDYMNFEKSIEKYEYSEETGVTNFNKLKRRYDSILIELLRRVETHEDLYEISLWVGFIQDLPRINERVIENLVTTHDKIIATCFDKIKKESFEKKALIEQLPHLKLMRGIYLKLKRPSNLSDKILTKFLGLTKSQDSHVIAQSILFLKSQISNLGKYEHDRIREYSIDQFRDLVKINESTPNAESQIISLYPLYFSLLQTDEDLLLELPSVYSESHEIVRAALNKHLDKILKNLDTFRAEKLVQKCTDNCLSLVIFIIEGRLFKAESMLKRSLSENKLLRRIKSFFSHTNYIEILISLSDKIALKDFFKPEENFIWEKVKQFERLKAEENNKRIFTQLNMTKNEAMFKEEFKIFAYEDNKTIFNSFSDKLILYILFYILTANESITEDSNVSMNQIDKVLSGTNDLPLLLKYYQRINSEKSAQNISGMLDKMTTYKRMNPLIFLGVVDLLVEQYGRERKDNSLNHSIDNKSVKSDEQTISNESYVILEMILNKFRDYLNLLIEVTEPSDNFINELINFIKKLSLGHKEMMIKSLDERMKNSIRTKDFILFSDI